MSHRSDVVAVTFLTGALLALPPLTGCRQSPPPEAAAPTTTAPTPDPDPAPEAPAATDHDGHSHGEAPPGVDGREMLNESPVQAAADLVIDEDATYDGPPFIISPAVTRDGNMMIFLQADIPNDQYLWSFDGVRIVDGVMQGFITIVVPAMGDLEDDPRMLTMPIPVNPAEPVSTFETYVRLVDTPEAGGPYVFAASSPL